MDLSAVLLAGGESRRMGRDKATVEFQGKPLWERQRALLQSVSPKKLFVSGRSDPAWRPSNVSFVADEPPSRGPLSGLAATLRRIETSHVLVLAIDLPFVAADYLRSLKASIVDERGIVPMFGGSAEPLVAIYPKIAQTEFADALSTDNFSLQNVVRTLIAAGKLVAVPVPPAQEKLFRNLNEPADLLLE